MLRTVFDTQIGLCALSWNEKGLSSFTLPPAAPAINDSVVPSPEIEAIIVRVKQHLRGESQDFADLTYDFENVPVFQAAVLRATLGIKSGQTSSYGAIATVIGQPPAASRAVGAALGANRWPLLIPCHRIVSATGRMVGFSGPGGIKTKLKLLALEGAELFAE